jgi:hypothetical protein
LHARFTQFSPVTAPARAASSKQCPTFCRKANPYYEDKTMASYSGRGNCSNRAFGDSSGSGR